MRLIDADALMNKLRREPMFEKADFDKKMLYVEKSIIDAMPTIDAVPVVRCKDCIYYENSECACPYIWMSDGAHMYTQADDFCSYGERKDYGK